MSMVDLRQPDFNRYPNFERALQSAYEVILEPGDAVYIPRYWWHNVESLDNFSMLINYWWGAAESSAVTPYQSMLHSLLSIPQLPQEQREVWRNLFDYYVFQIEHDPVAHLPNDLQDILGDFAPERQKRITELLAKQLLASSRGE